MLVPTVSLASPGETSSHDLPGVQLGRTGLLPPVVTTSAEPPESPRWTSGGLVYIIVQSNLYASIPDSIDLLEYDIEHRRNAPYEVEIMSDSWTTHTQVKTTLQNGYSLGMVGAILVGNIPVAWYKMLNDPSFGEDYWETFPIDLFYMDLDGTWDGGGGGSMGDPYPSHLAGTGDLKPEIWVGRLFVESLSSLGTEQVLIENYIEKVDYYSRGLTTRQDRALVYVDDDWYDWADEWSGNVGLAYPDRTLVKELSKTIKTDYMSRLPQDYEWLSLFSHTGIYYHALKNGAGYDYIYNTEISNSNAQALFYNLYCCGASNYSYSSSSGYITGHYVFSDTSGLVALGSAKTGSMLGFQLFYQPLSEGACIGEAFNHWFNNLNLSGIEAKSWYYGMNIAGDPTLETGGYEPPYEIDLAGKPANGWSFTSFPVQVSGHIETVLNDAKTGDGGTDWDVAKWFDGTSQRWMSYRKGTTTNTFSTINNQMGIWLHLTQNTGDEMLTLGVSGSFPSAQVQIQLYAGWNMVGYPSQTPATAFAALAGTNADIVSVYTSSTPYIQDRADLGNVTMTDGSAYWVKVPTDCTWDVPFP